MKRALSGNAWRWMIGVGLVLAMARPALGWSTKEHILMTRVAAERLLGDPATPAGMKQWLREAVKPLLDETGERDFALHARIGEFPRGVDGLPFWATMPDLLVLADRSGAVVAPFGVKEQALHYIDLEYLNADPVRRRYADDLSNRPKLQDIPRDMNDPRFKHAGMLPFTVEIFRQRMVDALKAGRLLDRPGQLPRDDHAVRFAGMLAHYLEDNTQPQHATIDYKSLSYFARGLRAPNVHGDMEYRLLDDDSEEPMQLREEFWQAFTRDLEQMKDTTDLDDLWKSTLQISLQSYEALPTIGRAAQKAYPDITPEATGPWHPEAFFHYTGPFAGRQMSVLEIKANRMALAVLRVQRVWRDAWDHAGLK